MQHRYVGDIGDCVKLVIPRALSPGRTVGVAWWLLRMRATNKDGRDLAYLDRPREWRHYDPGVFDALVRIHAERTDV